MLKVKKKFFRLSQFGLLLFLFISVFAFGQDNSLNHNTARYDMSDGSCFAVYFLDVGQADSALIICKGEAMIIDGGNRADADLVEKYMEKLNIRHLKYIVATHAHEDHIGGLPGALKQADAEQAFSPVSSHNTKTFKNFVHSLQLRNINITKPQKGETDLPLGMSKVEIFTTDKNYKNTNNTSIVVKIIHENTSFVFTGDIEAEAEKDFVESGYDLTATVLKAPHHGSSTSDSDLFLKAVRPDFAVISVGKNNTYGHPSKLILERFNSAHIIVYRTDISGTIKVLSDGQKVFFSTMSNSDF